MAYRPEFISAVEEEQRATIARLTAELEAAREDNAAFLKANEELGPALAAAIARAEAAEALLPRAYEAGRDDAASAAHKAKHLNLAQLDAIGGLTPPADLAARLGGAE